MTAQSLLVTLHSVLIGILGYIMQNFNFKKMQYIIIYYLNVLNTIQSRLQFSKFIIIKFHKYTANMM